jgi:hypothetical protein
MQLPGPLLAKCFTAHRNASPGNGFLGMPRFYFHVDDGGHVIPDRDGFVLPDIRAVRAEAISAAGEMIRDLHRALTTSEWRMDVTNAAGQPVLTLRFSAEEH